MAKELPYFKFVVNEWITGDITLEPYYMQGIFISLCAFYWSKDCNVSIETVRKRFKSDTDAITDLIDLKIIKDKKGRCVINFLDEQMESKEVKKITSRENGKKGGRPRITKEKPIGLILGNQNETETKANENLIETNIEERKGKEIIEEKILLKKEPKVFKADLDFSKFDSSNIKDHWSLWVDFKKDEFKKGYKSVKYEQIAVEALAKLARGSTTTAEQIIMQSISNRYQGLFELKQQSNGTQYTAAAGQSNFKGPTMGQRLDEAKRRAKEKRMQQGGSNTGDTGDELTSYTDAG